MASYPVLLGYKTRHEMLVNHLLKLFDIYTKKDDLIIDYLYRKDLKANIKTLTMMQDEVTRWTDRIAVYKEYFYKADTNVYMFICRVQRHLFNVSQAKRKEASIEQRKRLKRLRDLDNTTETIKPAVDKKQSKKRGRPTKADKKVQINAKIPPYLKQWIKEQPESVSWLIETALREYYTIPKSYIEGFKNEQ